MVLLVAFLFAIPVGLYINSVDPPLSQRSLEPS